jgi:hypothetical protein
MSQQMNEKQVLEALERLSPQGKKNALRILLSNLDRLNLMVSENQRELIRLCEERGLDFYRMSEDEREQLIDDLVHEE